MFRIPRTSPRLVVQMLCLLLGLAALVGAARPIGARDQGILYPNLKTLPPGDLESDTEIIDGKEQHVLRFSNTIWNAGNGALELRGNPRTGNLVQRLYTKDGDPIDRKKSDASFQFHPQHDHWHLMRFAQYELWEDGAGDRDRILKVSAKTSFCIMDTYPEEAGPNSPTESFYQQCGQDVQGLSAGWADSYASHLWDQWVVLGDHPLRDGKYFLRSVADPANLLGEGGTNRNSARSNKALTCFTVAQRQIVEESVIRGC